MLDSVIHVSNYLMMNLSVDLDNQMKIMDFINQANTVLSRFNLADSVLKTLCFSHTVSVSIVDLCCVSVQAKLKLLKSLTITFCIKFGHFLVYHILLLFIWLLSSRVCIICCHRQLVCKALNHDSVLVHSVFQYSVHSCSNFIG